MNEFFRCLLGSHPFANSAVTAAADAAVHAEAVHQRQLHEVVTQAEELQRVGGHQGLVVWGEAGTGKSHLLARFSRWAEQAGRAHFFLFRSLPANPATVPWHIVKSVIRQMTGEHHRDARSTALGHLVRKALDQAMAELPPQAEPYRAGQALTALRRLVDRRLHDSGAGPDTLDVCDVLFRFLMARGNPAALSALRWLAGEPLDPTDAARLGVRGAGDDEGSVRLPQAASAQSVLIALAAVASLGARSVVLGFDQVDSLAPEQLQALAQFLHPLIDHSRNLLVILSGVQEPLLEQVERGVISRAAWDRLAHDRNGILLGRIPGGQARQILDARLRQFIEPFLTLPAVRQRVEQDPLFPLGSVWFEQRSSDLSESRARDVIHWAHERWREQQARLHELGGPAWLEQCCSGRCCAPGPPAVVSSGVPDRMPRALTVMSGGEPAAAPRSLRRLVPSRARLPGRSPEPSPSPGRGSRKMELGAWAVTAVNLLALLLLILRSPSTGPEASRTLAQRRSQASALAGNGSSQPPSGGDPGEASPSEDPGDWAGPDGTPPVRSPSEAEARQRPTEASVAQKTAGRASAQTVPGGLAGRSGGAAAPGPNGPARGPGSPQSSSDVAARGAGQPGGVARPARVGTIAPAPAVDASAGGAAPALAAGARGDSRPRAPAAGGGGGRDTPAPAASGTAGKIAASAAAGRGAGTARRGWPSSPKTPAGPAKSALRPITIVDDPELRRLLDEAWGLIDRGDYGPGRLRLMDARKANSEDPRADFSLGLLDALIDHDWKSAEERFASCVRFDRENVSSLNNLAVAQVYNHEEDKALNHWKAILDQDAATADVVHNLGCLRYLIEQGEIRRRNSLVKSLDRLYTEAAVATASSFHPKTGFHLMALVLPDGSQVGWADARKMQGPTLTPKTLPPSSPQQPRVTPPSAATPPPGSPGPVPAARGNIDPNSRYRTR